MEHTVKLVQLHILHCANHCCHLVPRDGKCSWWDRPHLGNRCHRERLVPRPTVKGELVLDEVAGGRTKMIFVSINHLDQGGVLAHFQESVKERVGELLVGGVGALQLRVRARAIVRGMQ